MKITHSFNKIKKKAPHHTDYLFSDDDYLQPDIFAPYTQEYRGQGVQKPFTYHRTFSPHPTDTQNQQPIQMHDDDDGDDHVDAE